MKSVVTTLSTALVVLAGLCSVSAQTVKVGNPGYYQACLEKPEVMRLSVIKPNIIRPDIEKPDIQNRDRVRPDLVKPVFQAPQFVKPVLVRPEYDNRCERYVATSLLPGGLNLKYSEGGVVSFDLNGVRNLALAQEMIGKADAAKGTAGFTMTPRELVKMTAEECSCGNGVNTANTPVIVRR
jgi:hypothetical protein